MAVTKLAAERLSIGNTERLMVGNVLPDAYAEGFSKNDSHLKINICGNAKKTYNLTGFRKRFEAEMKTDELYLGYYLHLVQDLVYRSLLYNKYNWNPGIEGNVERLHGDYRFLNSYVVKKYNLENNIKVPDNFPEARINEICPFDTEKMLSNLQAQFISCESRESFFITEEMADNFIKEASDICVKELQAFFAGEVYVDEYKWAWNKKVSSLLETTQNTRDLGGYKAAGGKYTKYNSLIRSDNIMYPNERDINFLTANKICTIIDMRGEKDILAGPSPFAEKEGFRYFNIPIEEGGDVPKSIADVPYSYMRIAESKNMPEVS